MAASQGTLFKDTCENPGRQRISVNGVPLQRFGRVEQLWEEVMGSPELLGSPVHVPLRPGAIDVPQVAGPREFGIGMLVHGKSDVDLEGHNHAWRTLVRLLWSTRKPLLMTRTMVFPVLDDADQPTDVSVAETHQCRAKLISGLDPAVVVPGSVSRLALRFLNIDGYWYALEETLVHVDTTGPAVVTMPGDADTSQISIELSGGTGLQTVTNTTNGCLMTYNGSTAAAAVNVDVMAFSAVQTSTVAGEGGPETVQTSVIGNITHAGDAFWMRMEPGENTLTLTGSGSADIRARAAYL